MPAAYLMAWEPTRRRWWKQYRNKRYVVSCRQLDAPETKEGSYQAANAWWLARKAEIDGKLPPHPLNHLLEMRVQRLAWARAHGREDLVSAVQEEMKKIEEDTAGEVYGHNRPLDVPNLVVESMQDGHFLKSNARRVYSVDNSRQCVCNRGCDPRSASTE